MFAVIAISESLHRLLKKIAQVFCIARNGCAWLVSLGLLFGSPVLTANADNATQPRATLVTAIPVLDALSRQLLAGTHVAVAYLPPKRLPVSRLPYWLQHKSRAAVEQLGDVDAFPTVERLWPDYAIYAQLRQQNIRVVPVDATHEMIPGGARISLADDDVEQRVFFWLDPSNLLAMSQILSREFVRLWPEQQPQIDGNQEQLANAIREYTLSLDQLLLEKAVDNICVDDEKLLPMARSTLLPVELKTSACMAGSLELAAEKRGAKPAPGLWLVDSIERPISATVPAWLNANYQALESALNAYQ